MNAPISRGRDQKESPKQVRNIKHKGLSISFFNPMLCPPDPGEQESCLPDNGGVPVPRAQPTQQVSQTGVGRPQPTRAPVTCLWFDQSWAPGAVPAPWLHWVLSKPRLSAWVSRLQRQVPSILQNPGGGMKPRPLFEKEKAALMISEEPPFTPSRLRPLRFQLAAFLLRWLMKSSAHSHASLLIRGSLGHTLSVLFRTRFLIFCKTDRLRIFQTFKLCFPSD